MIKTACECHVAVWILHSLMVWSPVLSSQMRLLIWAPLTKKTHRVNLKETPLFLVLCAVVTQPFSKIDAYYICVSLRCAPGIFSLRFECCGISTAQ